MKKLFFICFSLIGTSVFAAPIIIKPYPSNFNSSQASMVAGGANVINQFSTSIQECLSQPPQGLSEQNRIIYYFAMNHAYLDVVKGFFMNSQYNEQTGEDHTTLVMTKCYNSFTENGTIFIPIYANIAKCFDAGFKNYPVLDLRNAQQALLFKNIALSTYKSWWQEVANTHLPYYVNNCEGKNQTKASKPECFSSYNPTDSKILGLTKAQWIKNY